MNGGASPEEETLSPEELAGRSDQFAERGIDLGGLLGTVAARPKPKPASKPKKDSTKPAARPKPKTAR